MALRYAVASGNWSNTATWNGGTLPTASDDVYSNSFTVTVDQDVTVLSLRNTAGAPAVVGGTFQTLVAGHVITVTGAGIICGFATIGTVGINASGAHTTINGLITGGVSTSFFAVNIPVSSANTNLTVVGNVLSGASSSSYAINNVAGNNVITVTGNITANGSPALRNTIAGTTVNVTGNVTGGSAAAAFGIQVVGTSTVNVTGNVTGLTGAGISCVNTNSPITCIGTVTAGIAPAISSAGTVTLTSPCVNSTTANAVNALSTRFYAASPITWTFKNELGANKILYSAGVALGNPDTANVRSEITYGASSELTGTLIVPSPSNVVSGVPTDATVGTYTNTPAAISTELFTKLLSHSDFNTASSFGKLVKDNLDAKSSDIKKNTDLIPAAV
jgi:hypothetical protein